MCGRAAAKSSMKRVSAPSGNTAAPTSPEKRILGLFVVERPGSRGMEKMTGHEGKFRPRRQGYSLRRILDSSHPSGVDDAEMRQEAVPQRCDVDFGRGDTEPQGNAGGDIGVLMREENALDTIYRYVTARRGHDARKKVHAARIEQPALVAVDDEVLHGLDHALAIVLSPRRARRIYDSLPRKERLPLTSFRSIILTSMKTAPDYMLLSTPGTGSYSRSGRASMRYYR